MNQISEHIAQRSHRGPELWRERGELVELLGHSLFVIDESPNQSAEKSSAETRTLPTILLLHGFPTSSWDWQPIWSLLAN